MEVFFELFETQYGSLEFKLFVHEYQIPNSIVY